MRFDDSLETVLAGDMSTRSGAQSAWRQLVDLIGRRRAPPSPQAMATLDAIRALVPAPVRASSARALAFSRPPAALVRMFAKDDLAIAAPVLAIAQLSAREWIDMLPGMSPSSRSILRHRRDLPDAVTLALESFGPTDFVLATDVIEDAPALPAPIADTPEPSPATTAATEDSDASAAPAPMPAELQARDPIEIDDRSPVTASAAPMAALPIDWTEVLGEAAPEPVPAAPIAEPVSLAAEESGDDQAVAAAPSARVSDSPVASAGEAIDWTEVIAARSPDLPTGPPSVVLASVPPEPLRIAAPADSSFVSLASVALGLPVVVDAMRQHDVEDVIEDTPPPASLPMETPASAERFEIADLVARIDAFQRKRESAVSARPDDAVIADPGDAAPAPSERFDFETDAAGIVRWVSGVSRMSVVGVSLRIDTLDSGARVDGVAAGAFRRRSAFADARMVIDADTDAAGHWQISGVPAFDRKTGRFTGYRGTARRPRRDERAELLRRGRSPSTDSLRQLVHELRTPTTAIAGFAEMIEGELLGPVASGYRHQASAIRDQAMALLGAIDDLDLAARIEAQALDLRPVPIALEPLLTRVAHDLAPLATLRGARLAIEIEPGVAISGDDRAVDRLIGRLMAALVAAATSGETIGVRATDGLDDMVVIAFDRPQALAAYAGETLMAIDAESEAAEGAPLLGTGFALRLARNIALELGGSLVIGADCLTLRLPAVLNRGVDQVSTN